MLFENASKILERKFKPLYFFSDSSRNLGQQKNDFKKFISFCDIVLELPVERIVDYKDELTPIVFFALGFMTNPFHFLIRYWQRLKSNNSIIFSSKADREIFNNHFGKNIANMGYICPFPLDTDEFRPQDNDVHIYIRKKFNIPLGSPLLLYAGRINIQKNIHTLLKIFKELIKVFPSARLCIAGGGDRRGFLEFGVENSGYKRFIQEKCVKYGIADKVIMAGCLEKKELIPLYSSADVLLNCTVDYGENFGYAQVEAMACGTPVICSNWGGLKDTVIHGQTGYHMPVILSNNGVKVDWQKGLIALISLLKDKAKLVQMSKYCIEYAKVNFSFDRFSDSLELIFLDTLKRKAEAKPVQRLVDIKKRDSSFMNSLLKYLDYLRKDKRGIKQERERGFFKQNYNLYKFFIAPYSSVLSAEIFQDNHYLVPYFLQDAVFTKRASRFNINDPIWPESYRLKDWELEALSMIDGKVTITDIYRNLKRRRFRINFASLMNLCKYFTDEGVVSFINN